MTDEKSTELAPTTKTTLSADRYEPRDFSQLLQYGKIIVKSKLCPSHINRPEDAVLIIQRGAELGLTAMTALQNMYVFDGKVTLPASLSVGVVKRSPLCEWFRCTHSDMHKATYETKRQADPEPVTLTYTIDQAKRAGLLGKDNWKRHPAEMLRARCSIQLARMVYEDLLAGVYSMDELTDSDDDIELEGDTVADPSDLKSSGRSDDAIDAEFEEADAGPVDYSDDENWQGLSRRLHALINETGLNGDTADKMREALKSHRGVESFTHISPQYLAKIVNRLAGLDPHEQDDGSMSPRMAKILDFTGMSPGEATESKESDGEPNSTSEPVARLMELALEAVDDETLHRYMRALCSQNEVQSLNDAPKVVQEQVEILEGHSVETRRKFIEHSADPDAYASNKAS